MGWLRALGLPLPIAATRSLENTWDKSKIELCMSARLHMSARSKRAEENEKESANLIALAGGGGGGGGRLCS